MSEDGPTVAPKLSFNNEVGLPLTVLLAWCMGSSGVFTAEAVSQLVGGLACFVTMCLTVYRPLGRLAAGEGVR